MRLRTYPSHTCPVEACSRPRDYHLAIQNKGVVARLEVSLASGETDGAWRIALCTISPEMREQSPATVVRNICRTFEQASAIAATSGLSNGMVLLTYPSSTSLVERRCHPRNWKFSSLGKSIVAQVRVGETDNDWRIARSAIRSEMREQSFATVVRDTCRASEQPPEAAHTHESHSMPPEIIK